MRVILGDDVRDVLRMHARSCMPQEACALLLGKGGTDVYIHQVVRTPNAAGSATRFTIAPEDLIAAYRMAAQLDLGVVGIFHSHPTSPAVPSSTDIRYMTVNDVVWVIQGSDGQLRAWILNGSLCECVLG